MPKMINDNCRNCGDCLIECLSGAISPGAIYRIDPNKCIDCGNCVEVCRYKAIVEYIAPIESEPIESEINS